MTVLVDDIATAVDAARHGQRVMMRCPSHEDDSPSLSVAPGAIQPVVLHCHAGCTFDQIMEASGLTREDISTPEERPERDLWTPAGQASQIYPYRKADGTISFEVLRVNLSTGKKRFFQRHKEDDRYVWTTEGCERVLYRLPQVLDAVRDGRTIHIAEGEKCVHALLSVIPAGDEATCNPMGAGKWTPDYAEYLAGATVVVYSDSDDVGRVHAREVRETLLAVGCMVKILEPPAGHMRSGKPINDVADHLQAGFRLDTLLETTPESEIEKARTGIDVLDVCLRPRGVTEFVIPNTLAKGERLLLIGFEGQGKSTLCRQIAVMVAAGMHPFTGAEIEPKKVLFIDAENHPDQIQDSWIQLTGLATSHGHPVQAGMLTVMEEWESEKDIASQAGAAWLHERVYAYRPDLIVMGPLTNLAGKDLRDDEPVRRLRNAVNQARSVCNSAFVMEHHAPHKGGMDKERPLRPYGSSLFLKWPDYGYGIKPTETEGVFEWHKNRGPRVRSRHWPEALREGRPNSLEWPWLETVL